eukprot:1070569-Amphidinium_carterae.1
MSKAFQSSMPSITHQAALLLCVLPNTMLMTTLIPSVFCPVLELTKTATAAHKLHHNPRPARTPKIPFQNK